MLRDSQEQTADASQAATLTQKTYAQVIAALDQSRDMIVLFDPDDRIVFANRAWKELNSDVAWTTKPGITYEQHIRAVVEKGLLPDAVGQEEEWLARRIERHKNPSGPFEISVRNDRWIAVNEQALEDGSTILVMSDITEVKKAELVNRAQNERFKVALQNIPAGVCVYDKNQCLVISNSNFAQMYGIDPEQLTPGMKMKEIMRLRVAMGYFADETPEKYIENRAKWVARRQAGSKTEKLNDGRIIQITQQPLEQGGWLTVHEDITERSTAQQALQDSEQQFRDLVEGSIQGFHIASGWKIVFANQALADIFGYASPEELLAIGTPLNLIDPREHERIKGYKAARDRGEDAPETYECRGVRKDGSQIIVEYRVRRVRWQGEAATQCVIVDVTDRKRAEAELIQHRDHLQELVNGATQELKIKADKLNQALKKEKALNEQQKHFILVASHEFRTPLSIIDSSVQRLLRRKDKISTEELESRAKKIRSAIKTMTNLMESTLAAARVDAGKADLQFDECDLREVVREVCTHHNELNESYKIKCDVKKLPKHIRGDGAALAQVFTNLLSNAVKYSPEGPCINVKGWTIGSDAFVSVQDQGLGIDEAELPKMFSRFFRASTSSGIPGTGIGLNLVKSLVNLHGGSISVESARGEGSTFTVRLPVDGPGEPAVLPKARAS